MNLQSLEVIGQETWIFNFSNDNSLPGNLKMRWQYRNYYLVKKIRFMLYVAMGRIGKEDRRMLKKVFFPLIFQYTKKESLQEL